jgi:tetratricopeptide (TPR) repeat protein
MIPSYALPMIRTLLLTLFIGLGTLHTSCAQSVNKLLKRAAELEAEGNFRDATNTYNEALFRSPGHKTARTGLQRSSQFVLDDMLSTFWRSFNLENYEQAIQEYQLAKAFERRVATQQIRLEWGPQYDGYYREAITNRSKVLFQEAAKAIDGRNYTQAAKLVRDIQQLQPEYPGLEQLKLALDVDPLYNQALDALRNNQPGLAISLLNQVSAKVPDYRDTKTLMAQLRNTNQLRIAMLPIEDYSGQLNTGRELSSHIINQILALRNPLIQLIDREYTERILEEQKFGLSGLVDERTAANAGRIVGGSTVLVGVITNVTLHNPGPERERRTAYLRERVQYIDGFTGMRMSNWQFRETLYEEIKEETKVTITFKYRLLSTETGRILDSDVITRSVINTVRYAQYSGPINELFPTAGNISSSELQRWRQRFDQKGDIKPVDQLMNIVQEDIAKEVAAKINLNGFSGNE